MNETDIINKIKIAGKYQNPLIQKSGDKKWFGTLILFSAIEKSHLNEDPAISQGWLVCPDGEVFRDYDLNNALAHIKYLPGDEHEALTSAVFYIQSMIQYSMVYTAKGMESNLYPKEFIVLSKIPEVVKKDDTYEITLYVSQYYEHPMFNPKYFELDKCKVTFGKNVYKYERNVIKTKSKEGGRM